ncbi:RING/U-box superfamily protein [Quillaja saponaria]|uniref:RING/U-box superfamily protein n=1 Tax=Quillaja saponaria TaxID=32244 RepID=A0AAD7P8T8_QUISA|nr:RING/U-box superfamily protein [Quillaja saponaria]
MDGVDTERRRKSLKERLGLKGMGCCGATWGFRSVTISTRHEENEEQLPENINPGQAPNLSDPNPTSSGVNLAVALAAERQFRTSHVPDGGNGTGGTVPGTPLRVSLIRLLEETDGEDGERIETDKGVGVMGNDLMCCVCMGRKKGAAFIPCGHTFCRVCSRELWLNRGSCPLCNRSILEILDIF